MHIHTLVCFFFFFFNDSFLHGPLLKPFIEFVTTLLLFYVLVLWLTARHVRS